jgi:hypothetical protein
MMFTCRKQPFSSCLPAVSNGCGWHTERGCFFASSRERDGRGLRAGREHQRRPSVSADAASADPGYITRDAHPRPAVFPGTDRDPRIVLAAHRISPAADGTAEVAGELTVSGAAHSAWSRPAGSREPGDDRAGWDGRRARSLWGAEKCFHLTPPANTRGGGRQADRVSERRCCRGQAAWVLPSGGFWPRAWWGRWVYWSAYSLRVRCRCRRPVMRMRRCTRGTGWGRPRRLRRRWTARRSGRRGRRPGWSRTGRARLLAARASRQLRFPCRSRRSRSPCLPRRGGGLRRSGPCSKRMPFTSGGSAETSASRLSAFCVVCEESMSPAPRSQGSTPRRCSWSTCSAGPAGSSPASALGAALAGDDR